MMICLNQHGDTICHAQNRNSANYCRECGRPLRYGSIYLHDCTALVGGGRGGRFYNSSRWWVTGDSNPKPLMHEIWYNALKIWFKL